jgi:hypothetical protein
MWRRVRNRAPAFTFFSVKISLKGVCGEEKKLPQGRPLRGQLRKKKSKRKEK